MQELSPGKFYLNLPHVIRSPRRRGRARLHWQVGGFLTPEYAVDVAGGALSALTSSRHSMPTSSLPYTYSCRQRAEQGLGLLQIERVEAFSKPIMDRSEKIEGLVPLSLIAQKTCHA